MSIQSTINQGMSVAALLFSQTDFAKETRDVRILNRDIGKLEQIQESGRKEITEYVKGADEGAKVEAEDIKENVPGYGTMLEAEEALLEKHRQLSSIRPTRENIENYGYAKRNMAGYDREAYANPADYTFGYVKGKEYDTYNVGKKQKQDTAKDAAKDALAAEADRIAATPSFDLSKLAEGPRARVERAYQRAERDTYYLNKNKKEDTK